MTRKRIFGGALANVVVWGFVGLVIWTDGWVMFAAAVLLAVFFVTAIGVAMAGR